MDRGAEMKEIRNKTAKPVRIPLPRGKTLHLGPSQIAQVADKATELAGFQKLISDGLIEMVGDGERVATNKGPEASKSRTKGGAKSFRRVQGDR
jgi:hypothetical protein